MLDIMTLVMSVNETVVIWVICSHESDLTREILGEEVIVCLTS
jgi:hypothetical protein